jgi:hypothetical protein
MVCGGKEKKKGFKVFEMEKMLTSSYYSLSLNILHLVIS